MNNSVNVSFGAEKEENIGKQNSFVSQEGRITFTEKNIYLGLGNGKYKKYDGLDTESKLTFNADITTEGEAIALGVNVLFFNEVAGKLQVTTRVDDNIITRDIFDDIVGQNDFKIYKADMQILLNSKANASEVYRKDETYSKNEIITLAGNFTTIEDKIAAEIERSTKEDQRLQNELNLKTKAVTYANNIQLNTHDFVIYAQEIYLCQTPFTTTGNFQNDKDKLYKLNTGGSGGGTTVVDYATNIKIEEGNMVIKDGGIYLCKNTIELTTTWETDKVNMVDFSATIDLTEYYNKGQIDSLLSTKMDILTQGSGVKVEKTDNATIVSADMDTNATADKLVVRDTDGRAFAKNSTTPTDDELINAKTFNDKTSQINEEFQSLREEVSGREKEFFKMNQILIVGQVGLAKPLEFQTNIPISNLTVSYSKSSYVSIDLEQRTYTLLKQANREDFPIVANITKGGSNVITMTINYDSTDAVVSSSNYTSNSYKTYSFIIHADKLINDNTSDWSLFTKTTDADIQAQLEVLKEKYKDMITLEDDAKGKTREELLAWLGIVPCTFANGKKQVELDPNDFTKVKLTGEEAITAIGIDTMIEFPLRGLRFKKIPNGYYISFTDNPNAEDDGFAYYAHYNRDEKKQAFYVGAYKGYILNSKLYSTRDVAPTGEIIQNFILYAQARGDGYNITNFYIYNYIIACALLCSQCLDSQVSVGYGNISTTLKSACCDKYGMFNELAPLTRFTNKNNIHTKYLGLEGFFESCCEYINKLNYDWNGILYTCVENNSSSIWGRGGYAIQFSTLNIDNHTPRIIRSIQCTNEHGFLPSQCPDYVTNNNMLTCLMSGFEIYRNSNWSYVEYHFLSGKEYNDYNHRGLFTFRGCRYIYNYFSRLCYI